MNHAFREKDKVFDMKDGSTGVITQSFKSGLIVDFGPSDFNANGRRIVQFSTVAAKRDLRLMAKKDDPVRVAEFIAAGH